jgi:hypothetical protein
MPEAVDLNFGRQTEVLVTMILLIDGPITYCCEPRAILSGAFGLYHL